MKDVCLVKYTTLGGCGFLLYDNEEDAIEASEAIAAEEVDWDKPFWEGEYSMTKLRKYLKKNNLNLVKTFEVDLI